MNDSELLFCSADLDDALRAKKRERYQREVDAITAGQLLTLSEEQMVEYVTARLTIDPLVLNEDAKVMEQKEVKVDVSGDHRRAIFPGTGSVWVPGHEVRVSIPFTGEAQLWKLRSNPYRTTYPYGIVINPTQGKPGFLVIVITQPADEPVERIKQKLDSTLDEIRFYVATQKEQLNRYNAEIPSNIRQIIAARKQRLEAQSGIQKLLGIPLKRREDSPSFEPLKITRQLVRPLPAVPASGFAPEPGITEDDYTHILQVIRHVGRTFETTPKTYAKHDEEELRDILLANLNGHYKGAAAGEVFRGAGKTDIRIEEKNRAAFVAECKVWRGPLEMTAAVDQLLSYLTWRDCKTAIVVFNKHNAKFSELLSKIPTVIAEHPRFRRSGPISVNGEWRFTLAAQGDDGREVIVTVFVFNLCVQ